MGDYIVGTDTITPINETSKDQTLGRIVESENVNQLSRALTQTMQDDFYTKELMNNITDHAKKYDWPVLLQELNKKIHNVAQSR